MLTDMADIEDDAEFLPPSPYSLGSELWCLGWFWRGQPGERSRVVEFWISRHRDLDGGSVPGRWVAGVFDGDTDKDVMLTFRHHFSHGLAPRLLEGDFRRTGNALQMIRRGQAA
jgi:hypothetical protein